MCSDLNTYQDYLIILRTFLKLFLNIAGNKAPNKTQVTYVATKSCFKNKIWVTPHDLCFPFKCWHLSRVLVGGMWNCMEARWMWSEALQVISCLQFFLHHVSVTLFLHGSAAVNESWVCPEMGCADQAWEQWAGVAGLWMCSLPVTLNHVYLIWLVSPFMKIYVEGTLIFIF